MRPCALLTTYLLLWSPFDAVSHRQERLIFMDTESNIDVSLQITVPFGIALPSVKRKSRSQSYSAGADDEDLYDDTTAQNPHLVKLDAYFKYLEVRGDHCRKKFLCQLAKDPEEFYPVSEIFLRELRHPTPSPDRYRRYLEASNGLDCEQFSDCRRDASDALDMNVVLVWRFLAAAFNIRMASR